MLRLLRFGMCMKLGVLTPVLLLLATFSGRGFGADALPAHALQLQQRGQFEQALQAWQGLARSAALKGDSASECDALLGQSEAYRELGYGPSALEAARGALQLAERRGDQTRAALAGNLVGSALQLAGQPAEARKAFEISRALASELRRNDILAAVLNNLGSLLYIEGRYDEAITVYREVIALTASNAHLLLHVQALLNAARASVDAGKNQAVDEFLAAAAKAVNGLAPSHDKAFALIVLGRLYGREGTVITDAAARAHEAYRSALTIGETMADARVQSFALGYLGQLYEREGRFDEAEQLTRRAIFAAQGPAEASLLYRWYWQSGRLLKAQHRADEAIAAYRLAVYYLQIIRADLALYYAAATSSFREVLGPVYFELADLLLARTAGLSDSRQVERYLDEARTTIELSKAAELQDYFQDGCVAAQQSRVSSLDQVNAGVAVIYPILLPERTEILVTFAGGSKQFMVPLGAKAVIEVIRDFRLKLERRTTRQFLVPSQRLYDILIRPLERELQARGINTLVFVPDGALRTVPMGALHDGTGFLIARYALATTPGMALTETQPLEQRNVEVLLSGISLPVQGFPSLPGVTDELLAIQNLYAKTTTLKDQEFVIENVERELRNKPFSVVHIASHGEFGHDVNQTFLLTFDEKITMNRLEQLIAPSRYRKQPIEMLTLSACQTAAGDDRAALGLAGVAIKAGARSALASLWYINDESTSSLMADFYRIVRKPGVTKAKALQQAQLALINDDRFMHPFFWAPFLLIGNWQ